MVRIDASIAKQLRDSITLNARMKAEHNARVAVLLEHNNRLEERARVAERIVKGQRDAIRRLTETSLEEQFGTGADNYSDQDDPRTNPRPI